MKYTCSVEINAPIDTVIALWQDEANFKHWQDGFQSIQHFRGTPHTDGALSKIVLHDSQRIELIETIISTNLPDKFVAQYEHTHMTNLQTTRFVAVDAHTTKYITEVEYTSFKGILVKLMAKLFPKKFREQSQKWMNQFKRFVEKQ